MKPIPADRIPNPEDPDYPLLCGVACIQALYDELRRAMEKARKREPEAKEPSIGYTFTPLVCMALEVLSLHPDLFDFPEVEEGFRDFLSLMCEGGPLLRLPLSLAAGALLSAVQDQGAPS